MHCSTARRQWEYSHAVNAMLTFVALVTITLSAFSYKRGSRSEGS
jgi:hypothetical protein